mmetsp:Transcript_69701/g.130088  ORF Transcript_69701/g.130088 Transcript_69701/m.130088 type:complete len:321 (-) Transcript_69701:29-991(-)
MCATVHAPVKAQEHHGEVSALDIDLQTWTAEEAVRRILLATNAYEMFGLHPREISDRSSIRVRFHRLSLLTHPDKNRSPDAAHAFRKVKDALHALSDDDEQRRILEQLQLAAEAKKVEVCNADWLLPDPEWHVPADVDLSEADRSEQDKVRQRNCLAELLAQHGPGAHRRRPRGVDMAEPWGAEVRPPSAKKQRTASASTVQRPMANPQTASEQADPSMLWTLMGSAGLAKNGWSRLESRSRPGAFYFYHKVSGRSVPDSDTLTGSRISGVAVPRPGVPAGWEKRESRTRPGHFYYVHKVTGETSVDLPQTQQQDARASR